MRKLIASALIVGLVAIPSVAFATKGQDVTLCHRTDSVTNPYVEITINSKGLEGHSGHTGPLVTTTDQAQKLKDDKTKWGDIIPPVGDFDGLNWTKDGQAILDNGCKLVEPVTPPPVDVCLNIEGIQTTVPSGDTVNSDGVCTPVTTTPPPSTTTNTQPPVETFVGK